jgi:hypothetical protein
LISAWKNPITGIWNTLSEYVFFFAYITDTGITLDTMNQLLEKIDARMAACVQK